MGVVPPIRASAVSAFFPCPLLDRKQRGGKDFTVVFRILDLLVGSVAALVSRQAFFRGAALGDIVCRRNGLK